MTQRNVSALKSPVIGRVICLGKELHKQVYLLPKKVQYVHGYKLLAASGILFKYAMRQIKGNGDYYKRAMEVIEEIQSDVYYIHAVCNCWNDTEYKIVAKLDAMCDEIVEHLSKLRNNDAGIAKSQDECK